MFEIVNDWYGAEGIEKIVQPRNRNVKTARDYQNAGVYETLNKNSKVTCITGGGKSFIILGRAYIEAAQDRKQIICVPTKAIGNGFIRPEVVDFDHDQITFEIANDLCTENTSDLESKSDALVQFIKEPVNSPVEADYIYLTTHKSMVRAYQKLQEAKELRFLNNLTMHIDEAHRVRYDEQEDIELANQLGKVVKHFIKYSDRKNLKFNLVTATFYRNNFEGIIPKDFEWDKEVRVSSLDFLKYCQYIKGFNYSLRIDKHEYIHSLKKIFDEKPNKPTIIFMPTDGSNEALMGAGRDKYGAVEEIKQMLAPHNLNVVELVTESTRMENLRYIERHKNEVDVVINIKVASEGFDWENCSRVIICGKRTSLLEIPQNIGRAMRDYKDKRANKNQPEIIQIISKVNTENAENEDLKEVFNAIMKLVGGQLLLLSDLYSKDAIKIRKIANTDTSISDYLNEHLNENQRINLDDQITQEFHRFAAMNEDEYNDDDLREIVGTILIENELDADDSLIRYFLNEHKRRTLSTATEEHQTTTIKKIKRQLKNLYDGMNVDEVAIDLLLEEVDTLGWIKNLSSKFFDIGTFTELEEKILNQFPRIERIKELKKWVIENNNL
jgi:hypothetical protein